MIHSRRIALLVTIMLVSPAFAGAQGTRNVLVLHHGSANFPANVIFSSVLREVFGSDLRTQLFEEYVDEDRLDADEGRDAEALRAKYEGIKIDLVVGDGRQPFSILVERGETLWPGTPKVFDFLDSRELPAELPPNMTGVTANVAFGATLELALRLLPNTRRVYYVGGVNPQERAWRSFAEQDFQRFAGRVEITWLSDLAVPDLLERLGRLPDSSVVIFAGILRDAERHAFVPARLCPLVASVSSAPVFGTFSNLVGCGIVGGSTLNFRDLASQTANLGVRVLERGTAAGLPVEHHHHERVVDWRQLQRWGIDEARLPRGTIVRYRTPSVWLRYRWYLLAGAVAMLVMLAIIVVLVIERRRRRTSELAVKNLSGRLISAGEEERKRIARELHDDISQRLSLVSFELASMASGTHLGGAAGHYTPREPLQQLNEIISDVHNLSHQLHSSTLQFAGLPVALKDLCRQLSAHHSIDVRYIAADVHLANQPDLALCFYRVAQEALNNSMKHSRSTRVDVTLSTHEGMLSMTIRDDGTGFDPSAAANGLGLATMRERMRLVEGRLRIDSRHGKGTEVSARAPMGVTQRQLAH